jgi:hypothetical protein
MPKTAPETDFTVYANKTPTPMQERFADWLLEETAYDPTKAKTKEEAFRMGVALGAFLRPTYQASDANQSARSAAAAPERAPKAKAAKPQGRTAKPATEPVAMPAVPKAKAGKGGPRKAAPKSANVDASDSPF